MVFHFTRILGSNSRCHRYNPIQKFGPQDCIASINAIIEKIDDLVDSKNDPAIAQLKAIFGLEVLDDIRDFAMSIAYPREYDRSESFSVSDCQQWEDR